MKYQSLFSAKNKNSIFQNVAWYIFSQYAES